MSSSRSPFLYPVLVLGLVILWEMTPALSADTRKLPKLTISQNKRFLVMEEGKPFFFLADTAWDLFHRLNREEADFYLSTRAKQGFTVIQAVALDVEGITRTNRFGEPPLIDGDPAQPNEKHFQHIDYVVGRAETLGLYMAMLPTWGDKVNRKWSGGPEVFTPEKASTYGEFIGRRYQDKGVIWVLGGDRPIETERHRAIWRAMAAGIRKGEGGRHHPMSYHIMGGNSTHETLHDESWLDFNMCQSGHGRRSTPGYQLIASAYAKQPPKPCMDSEANYENHPIDWKPENGWFDEHDVRKLTYWTLFAGGHGITYGSMDVWQFWEPPRQPWGFARTPWQLSIKLPGANQMKHVRALLESRPFLTRIPDQSLLADDRGDSLFHLQATRCSEGSYAMIYCPDSQPFFVNLDRLPGKELNPWWFNPRTGKADLAATIIEKARKEFTPPASPNPWNDWVLVLDDASRNFAPPGARKVEN